MCWPSERGAKPKKKLKKRNSFIVILLSLSIVALGQPARIGWLGAIAAGFGYALFFYAIPTAQSRLRTFAVAACWFTTVQFIQLSWMTSIEFQGYYILFVYFFLALWLGAQFGLLTLLVPPAGKLCFQQMLFCASAWTLMEWGRVLILCGLSWNPIGLALTHFTPSLQFASLFGILGLSFWVVLTNLAGLNAIRSKSLKHIGSWSAIAALPYFFGLAQLHWFQDPLEQKTLHVALIQTDLLPSEKTPLTGHARGFVSPFEQWERIFKYLKETEVSKRDLIVLPEAAVHMPSEFCNYPYFAVRELLIEIFGKESEKTFPPLAFPFAEMRDHGEKKIWCVSNLFWCQSLANLYEAEVVAGLDHYDRQLNKSFNSVFYFQPDHSSFERYDKQILLPMVEYLPWEFLRPLTRGFGIYDFFSKGEGSKVFGKKILLSPSICYEETFAELMRRGRKGGGELFVNVTNDNYFPNSSLHEQHLFHARVRAAENGVPLVRACNSGVTACIDCFGRILAKFESKEAGIKEGSLNYSLPAFHFPTLFSFWGEGGIISICFIIFICRWRILFQKNGK